MSDRRMEFERELVERLTDLAPRPRRDALERAKLAVAHTTQRRGWHVQLTGALVGLDWSSVGATAAIATAALVLGIAIGRLGLPVGQGPSTPPSPTGAPSPCVEPTPSAADSLSPQALAWTSDRQAQDWPGPLRVEPPGCAPILVPASTPGEMGGDSYHDRMGDVGEAFALVDIVDLEFRADCWFRPSGCVYFDMAADVPEPMPDPADQWIAYGIVVDTTGDGRPEFRYGIDNASPDADGGRMWRIDLTTGSTYISPLGLLEDPQVMDAVFPSDRGFATSSDGFNPGSIYAKRLPDQPVFRFYVWASVIVDGQIVATDYAPDAGWIELPLPQPQADE
jgi:hypothetical protein